MAEVERDHASVYGVDRGVGGVKCSQVPRLGKEGCVQLVAPVLYENKIRTIHDALKWDSNHNKGVDLGSWDFGPDGNSLTVEIVNC
jgi:hypothetical protein